MKVQRLIDANGLIIHFNDWALSASPNDNMRCRERQIAETEYKTICNAMDGIDNAPTIDAIPVTWLRDKMQKSRATDANPFGYVLAEWLQEQEAR